MDRIKKIRSMLAALSLAFSAFPLSAVAGTAMGQLLNNAAGLGVMPVAGAKVSQDGKAVARQDPNAVLGIFEGEDGVLFWFYKDAGNSAPAVSQHIRTAKMGSKNVGKMLSTIGKGWVILRDPVENKPHFTFYDESKKAVYYIPVPESVDYGEETLRRASIVSKDGTLMAVYGSADKGPVVYRSFSPNVDSIESTAAIFEHEKGQLTDAIVFEVAAFKNLIAHDGLKAVSSKLTEKTGDKPSAAKKMADFLQAGKNRSIRMTPSGEGRFLFKLQEKGEDIKYIYATASSIQEFSVR